MFITENAFYQIHGLPGHNVTRVHSQLE